MQVHRINHEAEVAIKNEIAQIQDSIHGEIKKNTDKAFSRSWYLPWLFGIIYILAAAGYAVKDSGLNLRLEILSDLQYQAYLALGAIAVFYILALIAKIMHVLRFRNVQLFFIIISFAQLLVSREMMREIMLGSGVSSQVMDQFGKWLNSPNSIEIYIPVIAVCTLAMIWLIIWEVKYYNVN